MKKRREKKIGGGVLNLCFVHMKCQTIWHIWHTHTHERKQVIRIRLCVRAGMPMYWYVCIECIRMRRWAYIVYAIDWRLVMWIFELSFAVAHVEQMNNFSTANGIEFTTYKFEKFAQVQSDFDHRSFKLKEKHSFSTFIRNWTSKLLISTYTSDNKTIDKIIFLSNVLASFFFYFFISCLNSVPRCNNKIHSFFHRGLMHVCCVCVFFL